MKMAIYSGQNMLLCCAEITIKVAVVWTVCVISCTCIMKTYCMVSPVSTLDQMDVVLMVC